jgi:hypothetical protein
MDDLHAAQIPVLVRRCLFSTAALERGTEDHLKDVRTLLLQHDQAILTIVAKIQELEELLAAPAEEAA